MNEIKKKIKFSLRKSSGERSLACFARERSTFNAALSVIMAIVRQNGENETAFAFVSDSDYGLVIH